MIHTPVNAPNSTPSTSNSGNSPRLPFQLPNGRVKVYYVGQKTYKTKAHPEGVLKTVVHYEKNGEKFKFATDLPPVVADLVEIGKMQLPVTATFEWQTGGALNVNVQ